MEFVKPEPRRCMWCNQALRWWQAWNCRRCTMYLTYNMPSPPGSFGSGTDNEPDKWMWFWQRKIEDWL